MGNNSVSNNNSPNSFNNNSNSYFKGELNTNDNKTLPLENDNYSSLKEFYDASDETPVGGFEEFETHNVTYLIKDFTLSNQMKQTIKKIVDDYEKEYPDKERGIKGILEATKFLKKYEGTEYAQGYTLDVQGIKNNFKLELARRGYTYSTNYTNKYYLKNGKIYTAKFKK